MKKQAWLLPKWVRKRGVNSKVGRVMHERKVHRFWGSNIWEVHRGPRRPVGLGVSERESGRGKVQRSGKEAGHEEPSRQAALHPHLPVMLLASAYCSGVVV